ncbi:exported hypothetical protein [Candidatus Nitrospira nitrosa]|uniref:Uncharacterized protein n=1 Tax=Candidatus Nitrospira nitrosa TaxID=1742972 RepID=A0A0S4LQ39_9BACT|nr:exported hypothetical protein [Candidatus Nitrospira nitrosa]
MSTARLAAAVSSAAHIMPHISAVVAAILTIVL